MAGEGEGFGTRAVHAGQAPDLTTGAIMTPLFLTSTYVQDGVAQPRQGHEYARVTNPTRTALEQNLASLEGGEHGLAFASGLAAIEAVLGIEAMRQGLLLPTVNHIPDPEFADLDLVPRNTRSHAYGNFLSNAFGFGGTNCCIVFRGV